MDIFTTAHKQLKNRLTCEGLKHSKASGAVSATVELLLKDEPYRVLWITVVDPGLSNDQSKCDGNHFFMSVLDQHGNEVPIEPPIPVRPEQLVTGRQGDAVAGYDAVMSAVYELRTRYDS